jgi:hypothetical protein
MNRCFIIGSDFNAKHTHWGIRLITTKGCVLYKAAAGTGCETTSTGKPIYWPTDPERTPDLIDFFVVKTISTNYTETDEGFDLNSDHSPICLTISDKIIVKDENPVLINKHIDLDYFNCFQTFWLQTQRSWVRFSALPHFLSSSGSGPGSTQPL